MYNQQPQVDKVIQKLIECHKLHINNFKQKRQNIDKDFIHMKPH